MLVLIYKRSGSKLLFPAVYSEKEMDEKMLVAKTDELTGAGILKADGDRFLLTEPYIIYRRNNAGGAVCECERSLGRNAAAFRLFLRGESHLH